MQGPCCTLALLDPRGGLGSRRPRPAASPGDAVPGAGDADGAGGYKWGRGAPDGAEGSRWGWVRAAGGEERGADAKQAALQSNKGSGRGCPDHPAGREEAGGQRGSTATSPGSLRHPGARRWGFKGRAGLPGPLLPGSGALRQPGSTGERGTARATHRPPAGTLRRSPTEGLFLSPLPLFSI